MLIRIDQDFQNRILFIVAAAVFLLLASGIESEASKGVEAEAPVVIA